MLEEKFSNFTSSKLEEDLSSSYRNNSTPLSILSEYTYTQEIKAKAYNVPSVLSPSATDWDVQRGGGSELAHSRTVILDS